MNARSFVWAQNRSGRPALAAYLWVGLSFPVACVDTSGGRAVTPQEYCEEKAEVDCRKYWQCFSDIQRSDAEAQLANQGLSLGTSQEQCTTNLLLACTQKPFTCPADMVFQEMTAASCVDALDSFACEKLVRPVAGTAPQCERVCTPRTLGGG